MAELVNLRMARKRKARAEAEKQAESNRLAHGRTKAEKLQSKAEKAMQDRHLEGHKREQAAPTSQGQEHRNKD